MPRTTDLELIASIAMDLPVGLWVAKAPSGEFVFANRMFQEILGLAGRDDVVAGGYSEPYGIHDTSGALYPEDKLPFVQALRKKALVTIDDIVIHRPDGGRRNVRARARPILDDGGEVGWIAITFTDITREVEAERARAETEARLVHAQKMESVGNLAGGVAHDFNNLLASMKILISLLATQESNAEKKGMLAQLGQVADTAASLTRSLLGVARRGKNLAQTLSVNDAVTTVADLVRRTIDPRIRVETRLDAARGVILGDVSQIEQIVLNLAINSRDAMPEGGRLTIRTEDVDLDEIFVRARAPLAPGPHVLLEISDTGTGIPASIRDRIFEPYFTTKNVGPTKGTGLGLATVYGIVATHRGSIEILDGVPHGTVMQILLPAAAEGAAAPPAAKGPPELMVGSGTVLLADDDAFVRESVGAALSRLGYTVVEARDGSEAVGIFRLRHHELAAIVLDMMMPSKSGREAWLEMRELNSRVPVLLVTGYALNEEAQRILDLGVQAFLAKPFDIYRLSEAMHRIVTRRR